MESFIYGEMNRASRDKDESKIKFYGAYAAALSYIIYTANVNRNDKLQGTTVLFRGLQLNRDQVTQYVPGKKIHLLGYTSTSLDELVARKFALESLKDDKVPVVFKINFSS